MVSIKEEAKFKFNYHLKFDYGWEVTLAAWLATPIIFFIMVFLAEIYEYGFDTYQLWTVFGNSCLLGFYSLVVWVPVGFHTSRVCRKKGKKKSIFVVVRVLAIFVVLAMVT